MALVNRWYQILEALVAQHQVNLDDLRSDLSVSMYTLQKSIDQLNDILDGDIQIKQQGNQMMIEVYDYARLEDIMAGSLRKESDFNSSNKRSSYLIRRLLQTSTPLLIDDLADEIGVSRTTINKDLKHVKELATVYQISVLGKPNHGLEVVGTEFNLRLFYIHHVYDYFDADTLTDETLDFLENLYQDFKIPRKTQELLTKVISITVARIRQEKHLTEPIPYYTNELIYSDIMEQLIFEIEMTYQVSLSQYEIDFLSFPLNTQFISGLDYQSTPSVDLVQIYQDLVKHIKKTLLVNFDDEKLFVEMHTHLKFLLNRLIFHVQTNDIFHGEIKNKYPLAFEMATVAGNELSKLFGFEIELSEISYLALYFEMILRENNEKLTSHKRKIAVVCTTGRGTATMMRRQLTRVLGDEIEITQYSEEDFNPNINDDYFAIFTTIPLKLGQLKSPVIHITNLFDDQWLREEWQKVTFYHQKSLKTIELTFMPLSGKATYQDYLSVMATVLEQEHLVDTNFKKRILERENKQSTIFGNQVAFPHTINHLPNKTVLMFGLVQHPLETENGSVKFIFLVAIPNQVEEQAEIELLELYDDIFRIANDEDLKGALCQVQTKAEFIAISRSKGVF
ncbi:BglG family transcription antiterminator [Streptococcus gallolyticus]|uniref:Lichenan operon transcriptional antiterminator n=1 Tax=Streptococcus gallolyticus TaxID=315405 RepID=A0A1H9UNI5_9STRE|nr:PRD domain-containing protein [Streptococcus gallolyticus]SES10697.1 lichenan operon transcriptional antiterminator [Streptococcus gallolyticus]